MISRATTIREFKEEIVELVLTRAVAQSALQRITRTQEVANMYMQAASILSDLANEIKGITLRNER